MQHQPINQVVKKPIKARAASGWDAITYGDWDEVYAKRGSGGIHREGVGESGSINYKVIFVDSVDG